MLVQSDRLGEIDVDPDKLLVFSDGLLGFPADTRFVMVEIDDAEAYLWLQSIDDPGLAFLTVIPWHFFPDYEPEIDEVTQKDLQITDPAETIVLCLVTISEGGPTPVTANLLGPLIVNTTTRLGRQIVLADSAYPTRAALVGS